LAISHEQFIGTGALLVIDGAFMTDEMLTTLQSYSTKVVGSLSSVGCGLKRVHSVISSRLAKGECRTFAAGNMVIQAAPGNGITNVMLTTAYSTEELPVPAKKGTWKDAVSLLKLPTSFLRDLVGLPPDADIVDPVALVKQYTGHDPLLPQPNAAGEIDLSKEALGKMQKAQLEELSRRTPGCVHSSTKSKADYVDSLYIRLNTEPGDEGQKRKRKREDIEKRPLLKVSKKKAAIVDFYCAHYGLEDKFDRQYYKYFLQALSRKWSKLMVDSVMFFLLQNAGAAHEERMRDQKFHAANRRHSAASETKQVPFLTFVRSILEAISVALGGK
jgi:hypothetical protein